MENPALANAEWWIRVLTRVRNASAFLVAIGVAGEFLGDFLSSPYQKTIDDVRETEIVGANERALASELALAKIRTPRSLTEEQKLAFIASMKPYKGIPFNFSLQPNSETINLMTQIGNCLKEAGLIWVPFSDTTGGTVLQQPGFPVAGIVAITGLYVQYDTSKYEQWDTPARTIVAALKSFGMQIEGKRITDGTISPTAIHLYIGEKPI